MIPTEQNTLREVRETFENELADLLRSGAIDCISINVEQMASRLASRVEAIRPKQFPVMTGNGYGMPKIMIPWNVAVKAYVVYVRDHGGSGQSLERVAERGGFYDKEMDKFYPAWREESEEIHLLRKRVAKLDTLIAQAEQQPAAGLVAQELKPIATDELQASSPQGKLLGGTNHGTTWFKECDNGHLRLMAKNWVDNGCPWCKAGRLSGTERRLSKPQPKPQAHTTAKLMLRVEDGVAIAVLNGHQYVTSSISWKEFGVPWQSPQSTPQVQEADIPRFSEPQEMPFKRLAEEAGEVVQAVMKVLRFGWRGSYDNGTGNLEQIETECGDFIAVMERCGLSAEKIEATRIAKHKKLDRITKYELGFDSKLTREQREELHGNATLTSQENAHAE
ncbi:MAG: hypothetical protein K8U57_37115 [Planctomycetes bacterium]|nr:hypothetical protein [Planctomycetota bacterium]